MPVLQGEDKNLAPFYIDKCLDRYNIPHQSWLFLKMEFSSFFTYHREPLVE